MKRGLAAMLLAISACVAEPPERAPLPDVATALPEPRGCVLSVGEPRGVVVDQVLTGSAADGTLQVDDIITSIDGTPTPRVAELSDFMSERDVDEPIEITYERDGDVSTATITLRANPSDQTRPQIGILIRTSYETLPIAEGTTNVRPSLTARPVAMGQSVLVLEPTSNSWQRLDLDLEADTTWVATTNGIFTLTGDETDPQLLELLSDRVVTDDGFQEWNARRLIGALGPRLVLVVTVAIPEQPGFVNIGVALFDPVRGETAWVTPVLTDFGVPVAAFGSPDGSGLVIVGADAETGSVTGVDFFDTQGIRRVVGELADLGTPVGWFDGTSMAFRPNQEMISVFDFVDGSTEDFTLPSGLFDSLIASVGDGRQVLAIDGRNLLISDITSSTEVRTLAENCQITRIGEPGWGL